MSCHTLKKERRQADGECQFCGVTNEQHIEDHDESLHVHHIVPQRADGTDSVENFITVCTECHSTLEKTQARGLAQLKNEQPDPQVKQERDALLERVELLERTIRSPKFYAEVIRKVSIDGEVVSETLGTRTIVTKESDDAREAYENWGSSLRRTNLSCSQDMLQKIASDRLGEMSNNPLEKGLNQVVKELR